MGKSTTSAPAADPNIGIAALKNAEVGEKWLDFANEQFEAGNIRQEEMDALTKDVINQQMATQEQANTWAQEDRTRTKDVFQPIEDEFIQIAKDYGSEANQDKAAAEQAAAIQKATANQRLAGERNMASMGLSPTSGRYQGVERAMDTETALASAGAQTNARQVTKDKGLALKSDAINMGKGLASSTAAAYGIGMNAGNSAVGNQQTANNNFYANQGVMNSGFGGAQQGYANQGNILNNLYGNEVKAWSAEQQVNAASGAGIGQLVGTLGSAYML